MASWFEGIFGADIGMAAMWTTYIAVGLIAVFAIIWLVRRTMSGTFVAGGRNRRPRLAVLDAAAVDSRRRLVLIRRDNTEHLVMIGGPTDIVVERGIVAQVPSEQSVAPVAPQAAVRQTAVSDRAAAKNPVESAESPARQETSALARPAEAPRPQPAVSARPAEQVRQASPTPDISRRSDEASGGAIGGVSAADTLRASQPAVQTPLTAEKSSVDSSATATATSVGLSRPAVETAVPVAPQPSPDALTATHDKGDLDVELLRELETTLDQSKATQVKREPATGETGSDLADIAAIVSRERV
ncbi:MAG: flagellar biosynthetic protein FliO [Rhizobiaceae bacterium]